MADLDKLTAALEDTKVTTVFIEEPSQFGSYKSAASTGAGDIAKLMFATGGLIGYFHTKATSIVTIPVRAWKGQLPKAVTKARVIEKHGQLAGASEHTYDAVGIGDFIIKEIG